MALVRKGTKQQQDTVGKSIGERRQSKKAQTIAQRPIARKPIDKFAGVSNSKNKKSLAGFAAKATYQQAMKFRTSTPYQRPMAAHIENGTAPVAGNKKPPSDKAILNFLDRVIDTAPKAQRIARNRAADNQLQRSQRRAVNNPQGSTQKA